MLKCRLNEAESEKGKFSFDDEKNSLIFNVHWNENCVRGKISMLKKIQESKREKGRVKKFAKEIERVKSSAFPHRNPPEFAPKSRSQKLSKKKFFSKSTKFALRFFR